jgi:Ser/Thr protein kinase RdoA (MazF antagonist)
LRALSEGTALVVQRPVPSPEGGHLLELVPDRGVEPIACSLLHWVEGRSASGPLSEDEAARLGELLATLHEHARTWRPPASFTRPRHGPDAWRAALARTAVLEERGLARRAELELMERVVGQAEAELAPLAADPQRGGLIHADLHTGNVLFHEGAARPIDFGRAGFGPWLYDLAECLASLGSPRRRDLVDAYAARLPLADQDLRRLEGYFIAAQVEVFGRCAPDPDEREYLNLAIPAWAPHMRHYLDGRPFLFEL